MCSLPSARSWPGRRISPGGGLLPLIAVGLLVASSALFGATAASAPDVRARTSGGQPDDHGNA